MLYVAYSIHSKVLKLEEENTLFYFPKRSLLRNAILLGLGFNMIVNMGLMIVIMSLRCTLNTLTG